MSAPQPVLKLRSLIIGLFLGLTLALNSVAPPTAEANPLFILGVMVAIKMLENKPKEENTYWHKLSRKKKNQYAIKKVEVLKKERAKMVKKRVGPRKLAKINKDITFWQRRADVTGGRHKKK